MGFIPSFQFPPIYYAHTSYRLLQLVLGLTVIGLYGIDLHKANSVGKYSDAKWVYAIVVSSLSAATALFYAIPRFHRIPFIFAWDSILFILWIALFGLFGKMYIKENPEGNKGIRRMKNAVWVDLANACLWFISALGMAAYWFKFRGMRTKWTGRATV
ncbi:hypothetical protein HYALB_00012186 [Hymenoscyphus albidus]|uniref:MARVEL domain-containing protein n=2 Tax=Hymenoscyphus TaxID=5182 RepID=A0A9N9KMP9_9HELO|nr:hypothetical protein HYFRA_00001917 [Hymenoscyphus fraxineus]CAG8975018.1 hypothetical protein HYALB_00012186 [Hymenoscyphus albidus]